jgi:HD-GYP domain-containing protein (c-di-GMP phosphodiesterase class II)
MRSAVETIRADVAPSGFEMDVLARVAAAGWSDAEGAELLACVKNHSGPVPGLGRLADRLLQTLPRASPPSEELLEAIRHCAIRYILDQRDYATALTLASAVSRAAPANSNAKVRAHKLAANCLAELCDYEAAVDVGLEGLSLAAQLDDREQRAGLQCNIGLACMYASLPAIARHFLLASLESARQAPPGIDVPITSRINLARLSYIDDDFEPCLGWTGDALDALTEAEAVGSITPTGLKYLRVLVINWRAAALTALDRPSEALSLLEDARSVGRWTTAPQPGFEFERAMAAWKLHGPSEGEPAALAALNASPESRTFGGRLDMMSRIARQYERDGRIESALEVARRYSEESREYHHRQLGLLATLRARPELSGLPRDEGALLPLSAARLRCESELSGRVQASYQLAVRAGAAAGFDEAHIFRKARLATLLGTHLAWPEATVREAATAAALCDIGMLCVPETIALKNRLLSAAEKVVVSEHQAQGAQLLESTRIGLLDTAAQAARFHHARFDAPDGGLQVPLLARVAAICSAFEALTHNRPWRPAFSVSAALQDIERESGALFDPELVEAFVAAVRKTYWTVRDWEAFLAEEAASSSFSRARRI